MGTHVSAEWRDILRKYCENPATKQRLASEGSVSLRTIDRWISGQSRPQKLEMVRMLADRNSELSEALRREFPEAFLSTKQPAMSMERIVSLPSEFYRRVVHVFAHVPQSARQWTIWHLVANQMLPHLDVKRSGLLCVVFALPQNETLQFLEGAGNGVWTTRQVSQTNMPAAEQPWIKNALIEARPQFIQSCVSAQVSPPSCFISHELIQSMCFFPFYEAAVIAGGLFLLSAMEDFFTPQRQALIEEYSCLLALAFSDSPTLSK